MIGLSKEDKEYMQEYKSLENKCKKLNESVTLNPISYLEDKNELDTRLLEQDLCMMLSEHEGFGLVGWEAIGAGIPLIVSKNSGLYQFVKDHHRELLDFMHPVNGRGPEEDLKKEVIGKLIHIKYIGEDAFSDATKLRDGLKEHTWVRAAEGFANVCGIPLKNSESEVKMAREKSSDTEPSIKAQDIDIKVEKEIRGILDNKKFVLLTEALYEELTEKQKKGENIIKVDQLTKYLLCCSSHSDVLVMLHKAVKRCYKVVEDTKKKEIFRSALDIFGWLIIRYVKPDWIEKNRTTIFNSITVPVVSPCRCGYFDFQKAK